MNYSAIVASVAVLYLFVGQWDGYSVLCSGLSQQVNAHMQQRKGINTVVDLSAPKVVSLPFMVSEVYASVIFVA